MKEQLLKYLKEHNGQWFKKVELYVLADELGYSPETCGRELRKLAEEKQIKVGYYDGKYAKNLAKYAYNPEIKKRIIEIINGKAYERWI